MDILRFCLLGVLVGIAGCSGAHTGGSGEGKSNWFPRNVQGNWVLRDVKPPQSAAQFPMVAVTFNEDYTYVARMVKDGNRLETPRGTYTYDAWNRRLYLHSGGEQRGYGAVVWFGSELHLGGQTADGKPISAVMVRSNLRVEPLASTSERRSR